MYKKLIYTFILLFIGIKAFCIESDSIVLKYFHLAHKDQSVMCLVPLDIIDSIETNTGRTFEYYKYHINRKKTITYVAQIDSKELWDRIQETSMCISQKVGWKEHRLAQKIIRELKHHQKSIIDVGLRVSVIDAICLLFNQKGFETNGKGNYYLTRVTYSENTSEYTVEGIFSEYSDKRASNIRTHKCTIIFD